MEPYYKLRKGEDSKGLQQLVLYYSNKGMKLRIDVGIKTKQIYWNGKAIESRCSAIGQDASKLNVTLREKKKKIEDIILEFKRKNPDSEPSCEYVKEQYYLEKTKFEAAKDVKQEFLEWIEVKSGEHKKGFMTVYYDLTGYKRNGVTYAGYHPKKLKYSDLTWTFFEGLKQFYVKKGIQDVTIIKRFKNFKMFLNYTYNKPEHENEWNHFKTFPLGLTPMKEHEVVIPTKEEINILKNLNSKIDPKYEDVRDLYLISCGTGLRYSDVIRLTKHNISEGFIHIQNQKTGIKTDIPLNELSKFYLFKQFNKYDGRVFQIPNQTLNRKLTELLTLLNIIEESKPFGKEETIFVKVNGVQDEITKPKYEAMGFHSGRRYFISTCVNSGLISTANVAKWTGQSLKIIEGYIKKGYNEADQMMSQFKI